jgi:hypothetical protein
MGSDMNLGRASILAILSCAVIAAAPAMAADPPTAPAVATPDAASPTPPPTAAPPAPPAATPPATRPLVAIVVTQELKDARWNREWGEFITGGKQVNDLADAITGQAQAMLATMGYDSKVVSSMDKLDGAKFYLTPIVTQNQQTSAVFALSRVTDTIVLQWRIADAGGGTLLLDTVTGVGESAEGNVFTASSEAKLRFHRVMDDLFGKSQTLLAPVLTHP